MLRLRHFDRGFHRRAGERGTLPFTQLFRYGIGVPAPTCRYRAVRYSGVLAQVDKTNQRESVRRRPKQTRITRLFVASPIPPVSKSIDQDDFFLHVLPRNELLVAIYQLYCAPESPGLSATARLLCGNHHLVDVQRLTRPRNRAERSAEVRLRAIHVAYGRARGTVRMWGLWRQALRPDGPQPCRNPCKAMPTSGTAESARPCWSAAGKRVRARELNGLQSASVWLLGRVQARPISQGAAFHLLGRVDRSHAPLHRPVKPRSYLPSRLPARYSASSHCPERPHPDALDRVRL